jgi:hypothetical protein
MVSSILRGGHHVDITPETTKAALRRPSRNALISLGRFGAAIGTGGKHSLGVGRTGIVIKITRKAGILGTSHSP